MNIMNTPPQSGGDGGRYECSRVVPAARICCMTLLPFVDLPVTPPVIQRRAVPPPVRESIVGLRNEPPTAPRANENIRLSYSSGFHTTPRLYRAVTPEYLFVGVRHTRQL